MALFKECFTEIFVFYNLRQSDEDNSSLTTSLNSAGVDINPTPIEELQQMNPIEKVAASKPVQIEPRVMKSVTTAV